MNNSLIGIVIDSGHGGSAFESVTNNQYKKTIA